MADASVLGIRPPATVRVDLDGWVQDWPFECVEVLGDEIGIRLPPGFAPGARAPYLLRYAYEHAQPQEEGLWLFLGRNSFTVSAGPPQAPSLN